jgi:hypothetical protein
MDRTHIVAVVVLLYVSASAQRISPSCMSRRCPGACHHVNVVWLPCLEYTCKFVRIIEDSASPGDRHSTGLTMCRIERMEHGACQCTGGNRYIPTQVVLPLAHRYCSLSGNGSHRENFAASDIRYSFLTTALSLPTCCNHHLSSSKYIFAIDVAIDKNLRPHCVPTSRRLARPTRLQRNSAS